MAADGWRERGAMTMGVGQTGPRPQAWFPIVTIVLCVWAGFTAFVYFSQLAVSEDRLSSLPADMRELYLAIPTWAKGAGAIAMVAGVAGLASLLLRRKWALPLFVAGSIGVLARDAWFVIDGRIWSTGSSVSISLSVVALVLYLSQVWLAAIGVRRGWLR